MRAGWAARYFGFLGATSASELNRFLVYLGMPALLFQSMANASWHHLNHPAFAGVFGLGCFLTYVVTVYVHYKQSAPLTDARLDGLDGCYGNVGFIGFPLCLAAFEPDSLPLATITAITTVSVLFGVAALLVEVGLQRGGNTFGIVKKVAVSLAKNPLLLAPVLGIAYVETAPPLPQGAERFLTLLASPQALAHWFHWVSLPGPKVLFIWPRLSSLVALKLFGQPAITWGLATFVLHLTPVLAEIAVVAAALPTGTGPYMLATCMKGRQYHRGEHSDLHRFVHCLDRRSCHTFTA